MRRLSESRGGLCTNREDMGNESADETYANEIIAALHTHTHSHSLKMAIDEMMGMFIYLRIEIFPAIVSHSIMVSTLKTFPIKTNILFM